ncbi:ABC transporter domain-containing protein [Candidatus Hydrogenisulfobacillus filiaventi]|uniref:ABC transporter domain-containing protein n=1 Tax=Candidatus Hydrogenisulfobacillus filiaventi TaxID=2707344 RepID=A0A6F8ZD66_9FIRM|nr:ABC transporter domain-containing protein [Candidatus Hydrogenisulfobacillus filiaventi]
MRGVWAEGVSKRFLLRRDRADSVGQLLVRMLPGRRPPPAEPFWALKDVSFRLPLGRSLGIVGNNGSGKSTLLKILTRTMLPTSGQVAVEGRTSALIELGAGFHPDFTGRENIYLNASILGIRRREVDRHLDDIIDFAGIRPFIDTPVKYYSSGMHARLGFSVAIHVEPEILIVDEVLAVGDEAFQQQCMDRIYAMKRQGVSILLVSHDLGSVERLMDEAIWLDRGVMQAQGRPALVVEAYRRSHLEAPVSPDSAPEASPGLLQAAWLEVDGRPVEVVPSGSAVTVVLEWDNPDQPVERHLVLSLRRPDGLAILEISSLRDGRPPLRLGLGRARTRLHIPALQLASGRYEVHAEVLDVQGRRLEEHHPLTEVRVQSLKGAGGLLVLPHEWRAG